MLKIVQGNYEDIISSGFNTVPDEYTCHLARMFSGRINELLHGFDRDEWVEIYLFNGKYYRKPENED